MIELNEKMESNSLVSTETLFEKELEEIIQEYEIGLRLFAYKYVRDWTIVDDLLQEVYIKVYINLNTVENRCSLKSWLYSITYNQCIDYLRKKSVSSTLLMENPEDLNKANSESAEKEVIKQFEKKTLFQLIDSLPNHYREPIILFYFKQYSYKEISEVLSENSSVIKSRLFRARRMLKEKYLNKSK